MKSFSRNFGCILFLLIFSNFVLGQCENNLILNGSFNDTVGEAHTALNWLIGDYTPDVNSADEELNSTPCYFWTGTPLASTDGGTWQNIFGPESVYQPVTLTVGAEYQITFEYAAQGIQCPENDFQFNEPVGVNLYFNNDFIISTPLDETQYTWENFCYIFTATESNVSIILMASADQYVGIDGFCLSLNSLGDNSLGPDTLICLGDSLELVPSIGGNYLWSDGSTGPTMNVAESGIYWFYMNTSIGCSQSDTIEITVESCDDIIEEELPDTVISAPNIFTPNDDQSNDLFTLVVQGTIHDVRLIIVNRWGNIVHETLTLPLVWDGRDKSGRTVTDGVYFWKLNYFDDDGIQNMIHGNVTVVR
jgi:gliding motility-associated-like protein